jgi:hypothetical protein
MPTAVGPNTKGEENLVFGYDIGDVSNSYKGEPTTNLYGNWNAYTGGSYEVLDNNTNYIKLLASAGAPWAGQFTAAVSAGTYTVSFQHRTDDGGSNNFNIDNDTQDDNIWNANITTTTEWQTYTSTKTHTGTGNHLLYFRRNGGAGDIYIRNVQIELKSHATPFVKGTRSATQGLLDLTGNSTIDLTNASFDSNAQMTFDGTSDYASIGYSTAINTPNGATYEIMLYPQGAGEFLSRGKSDSGTDPDNPRFYLSSNGYLYFDWSITGADTYVDTPASTATFNQWNHVVGVAQPGDQLRIYVNGVEASYNNVVRTIPSPIPNTEDPIIIGGVSWIPRYFDGKIAMVKLYNRALTASEIKSNYNAIKGRFNI